MRGTATRTKQFSFRPVVLASISTCGAAPLVGKRLQVARCRWQSYRYSSVEVSSKASLSRENWEETNETVTRDLSRKTRPNGRRTLLNGLRMGIDHFVKRFAYGKMYFRSKNAFAQACFVAMVQFRVCNLKSKPELTEWHL